VSHTPYLALYDIHVGHERRPGAGKVALHDPRALRAVWKFAEEFKPKRIVMGGDIVDCGVISHHQKGKPGRTEGLRLAQDMTLANELVVQPAESTLARGGTIDYLLGNHEDWLMDLIDEQPGLEDMISLERGLGLSKKWTVHPQGSVLHFSKHLLFMHGDQIKGGGENKAKAAVDIYDRCVRLGHYHTFQSFTKTSPIESELPRTGVVIPCLATKNPRYNESKPTRYVQGFNFGWVREDGSFSDYVVPIINGRFIANGKEFCG
jgi:hypothetical protein